MIAWLRNLFGRSRRIETKLDRLIALQEKTMGQLEDLVTAIDAETNAVAARIDHLGSELASALAAGQAPKAETLAALSTISDRLKSLGADPANPVPPPAPAPAPSV